MPQQDVDKLRGVINNLIKKANLQIIPILEENIKLDNSSFEIMISQFERDRIATEKMYDISKDPKLITDIVNLSSRISDLKSILKIRSERIKFLNNSEIEIFYLSNFNITDKKHTLEVNNKSIILASLLLFFSIFLFYIVIKR